MASSPSNFANFMRNNDPGKETGVSQTSARDVRRNYDSSDKKGDYGAGPSSFTEAQQHRSIKSPPVSVAVAGPSRFSHDATYDRKPQHLDYSCQNTPAAAVAVFASSSSSTPSSTSEISYEYNNNTGRYRQRHDSQKRRYPPHFDSRPNLKNDLSDSYQQDADGFRKGETDFVKHPPQPIRQHMTPPYDSNRNTDDETRNAEFHSFHQKSIGSNPQNNGSSGISSNNYGSVPITNPIHSNHRGAKTEGATCQNSSSRSICDPRPLPQPGKPRLCNAKAVGPPKSLEPRLGRKCLPMISLPSNGIESSSEYDYHISISELGRHVRIECVGCKSLLEGIPIHAIAIECPHCGEFYPTVECRVITMQ